MEEIQPKTGHVPATLRRYDVNNPDDIMQLSKALQDFVAKNKLSQDIQGNQYVNVEGWQFAGMAIGTTAIIQEVISECDYKDIRTYKKPVWGKNDRNQRIITEYKEISAPVYKYRAWVSVTNLETGNVIARGFAICSNEESGKHEFDEYAIASMAQTRAIGKGYRTVLGWIMKMAGFDTTPAEEMDQVQARAAEDIANKGQFTKGTQAMIDSFKDYEGLLSWAADMDDLTMNEEFRLAILKKRDELVMLLPEEDRPDFGPKKKKTVEPKEKGGKK